MGVGEIKAEEGACEIDSSCVRRVLRRWRTGKWMRVLVNDSGSQVVTASVVFQGCL